MLPHAACSEAAAHGAHRAPTDAYADDECNGFSVATSAEDGSGLGDAGMGSLYCTYLPSVVVRSDNVFNPLEDGVAHANATPLCNLMQVFAKTPTGKTITLDVDPSDAVDFMKVLVCDKTGIPVAD